MPYQEEKFLVENQTNNTYNEKKKRQEYLKQKVEIEKQKKIKKQENKPSTLVVNNISSLFKTISLRSII